jgi:transposase
MGDESNFERGLIARPRLAGASVIKTSSLLVVSRATVSKVMLGYTNHGKATSAKRNSRRKSTLTERDRRILRRIFSKNRRPTAAQVTAELNNHPEDPVSTKTVRHELHKPSIQSRAAVAKPLITESNAQMRKRWCPATTIKPGHQTTGNAFVIWSDDSSFTLFPKSGRVCVWRTNKEAYNPECLVRFQQ